MLRLAKVVTALVLVNFTFALYNVLTKTALNGGLDPGVFVLLRDGITAAVVSVAASCRPQQIQKKRFARPTGDGDVLRFWLLGLFGLYFGQYFVVLGLQRGTPVLASTWQNCIPAATFVMGLYLGTERIDLCDCPALLKLLGVAFAVGGALGATVMGGTGATSSAMTSSNVALSCIYFFMQVLFGGAAFWHLQKRLLARYSALQVVAWYYQYGWSVLVLVILPTATTAEQWALNMDDALALGVGTLLWPLAAWLLTYANRHGNPVLVMAFSPLQIAATVVLEYVHSGTVPSSAAAAGGAAVVLGLVAFLAGTAQQQLMKDPRQQGGESDPMGMGAVAGGSSGGMNKTQSRAAASSATWQGASRAPPDEDEAIAAAAAAADEGRRRRSSSSRGSVAIEHLEAPLLLPHDTQQV